MDLLKGYGSDDSSDSGSPPVKASAPTKPISQPAAAKQPPPASSKPTKKKGKRLLSLQAVLPPEILDRLSRPENEESSDEEGSPQKRAKSAHHGKGGDRSGLNSLLDELRSAPLQHDGTKKPSKKENASTEKSDGLGMAFMSYTTESTTKKTGEVVDVHAKKSSQPEVEAKRIDPPAAAVKRPPVPFARISAAAPIPKSMQQSLQMAESTAYPVSSQPETIEHRATPAYPSTESHFDNNNCHNDNPMVKSRKQKREEERALRTGAAFQTNNRGPAMEIHQPSPTEYAPTAHMAAIASRAAHLRGIGSIDPQDSSNYGEYATQKAKSAGVAMYDPKTGADVKGGVTAKHKSKHQINQLMVSAMGLEASRAGEAELARLGLGTGAGTGGGRADAKRKYGW
jgi:hypothetical protein